MSSLLKSLKQSNITENNATAGVPSLPAGILEAFIPGYSILSKFLLEAFGFDITFFVSTSLLVFGFGTAINFMWKHARENIWRYLMSYVRISNNDDIHDHVMEWVAARKMSKNSRNLLVKTGHEDYWDLDDDEQQYGEQFQTNGLINFSNWDSKKPPKFEPSYGTHYFFHRGNLFLFLREQRALLDSSWGHAMMRDDEYVTLACLGRSTQPLKDLIKEARDFYLNKKKACTTVRRPALKVDRNSRWNKWMRAATRLSRPMDTVVLDHGLKHRILQDINEYLHPATPRWYSNRGIPYRRGYLLHGPPGTGKSSLAWALAGLFGLDIYCISLVDPNLTEEELGMLFSSLPRRCAVLLEDIDSAGLSKRQESEDPTKSKDDSEASKLGTQITKAFESVQKKSAKDKEGISLSGLLNAIDGVASQEGRVLIMTTNFPDRLDEALTRPGRIDMKVPFTFATNTQIRELFARMYSPDIRKSSATAEHKTGNEAKDGLRIELQFPLQRKQDLRKKADISALTPPGTPTQSGAPEGSTLSPQTDDELALYEIARKFADKIPADTFTPAEIQGFLLMHKKEPERAVKEVEDWRDQTLALKAEKRAKLDR